MQVLFSSPFYEFLRGIENILSHLLVENNEIDSKGDGQRGHGTDGQETPPGTVRELPINNKRYG